MNNLTVGSLFSGIGGIDLGLERAGMHVKWQIENNDFCRKVLQKHWPNVTLYGDITELDGKELPHVDVIAGGFPCPVVSQAARGRNTGAWMWPDFFRIVVAMRPRYVIIENVNGLRFKNRRFREILSDLASCGYDAEWHCLPASLHGAPHKRTRLWMVAYSNSNRKSKRTVDDEAQIMSEFHQIERSWPTPPTNLRMDDGVSRRMDRLRALGNAVVPQVAEWIGERIVEFDKRLEVTDGMPTLFY